MGVKANGAGPVVKESRKVLVRSLTRQYKRGARTLEILVFNGLESMVSGDKKKGKNLFQELFYSFSDRSVRKLDETTVESRTSPAKGAMERALSWSPVHIESSIHNFTL